MCVFSFSQFMQGYSSKVAPRQQFGYGGMPKGGFGTTSHFWGGPSYKNPSSQPFWRGRSFSSQPRGGGSPYMPYQTPRDSYGMGQTQPGMGGNLPVSSPYYYTPPPLQGLYILFLIVVYLCVLSRNVCL